MHPDLFVKETKNGKGTFAAAGIRKNTVIMVFGGYVMTRQSEEMLPERIRDIAITIERNLVIGPIKSSQLSDADYVNHSCNPNCGIKGQISLVSMRALKKGEEIYFDYGTVLYQEKGAPAYELKCECASNNCRAKITSRDWKLPALQTRCKGFFPYYIQEEIDKINLKKKYA